MIAMTKRRSDNALVTKAEAAIAQANNLTVNEVNTALDQHPVGSNNKDRYLKRQLARAIYILDEL